MGIDMHVERPPQPQLTANESQQESGAPSIGFFGQPQTYSNFGVDSNGLPLQGVLALVLIPPRLNPSDAVDPSCQVFVLGNAPPQHFASSLIHSTPSLISPITSFVNHSPSQPITPAPATPTSTQNLLNLGPPLNTSTPGSPSLLNPNGTIFIPKYTSTCVDVFEGISQEQENATDLGESPGSRDNIDAVYQTRQSPVNNRNINVDSSSSDTTEKMKKNGNLDILNFSNDDVQIDNSKEEIMCTPPQQTVSYICAGSKKPTWIKPKTPKGKSKGKEKIKDKKMRQITLIAMSENFPKATIDVSTCKEFRGGSRQTTLPFKDENVYPAKRKSDEMEDHDASRGTNLQKNNVIDSFDADTTTFEPPTEILNPIEPDMESEINIFESSAILESSPKKITPLLENNPEVQGKSRESVRKVKEFKVPLSVPGPSNTKREGRSDANERTKEFKFKRPYGYGPPAQKFSPQKSSKNKFNSTEEIIKDFNKVPVRFDDDDDFTKVVRKKDERAKLTGWSCDMCRHYYEGLESQMDPGEIQRLKDKCSKHKSKQPMNMNHTPTGYWDTKIPSTEEAYANGLVKMGVASPSAPRHRVNLLLNSEDCK